MGPSKRHRFTLGRTTQRMEMDKWPYRHQIRVDILTYGRICQGIELLTLGTTWMEGVTKEIMLMMPNPRSHVEILRLKDDIWKKHNCQILIWMEERLYKKKFNPNLQIISNILDWNFKYFVK